MKLLVDELPERPYDCIFADFVAVGGMTEEDLENVSADTVEVCPDCGGIIDSPVFCTLTGDPCMLLLEGEECEFLCQGIERNGFGEQVKRNFKW